jgi:pyrroline-5-carboxylate reductase
MKQDPNIAAELPTSLVLVGAGKMGGAMLEGWLRQGLDPARVTVLDPNPSPALLEAAGSKGFSLNPRGGAAGRPEALVLGIKPQSFDAVAPSIAHLAAPDTVLVSILAGKTVADLNRAMPGSRAVVRAMPNLPASIGAGATGAYASPATSPRQRAVTHALLAAVGQLEWVDDERLIDVVTAVSGSGPAYLFLLVECLAEAARAAGLEGGLADRLARQTIIGASQLIAATGIEAATLRQNVTSPGGTTAAALEVLMGDRGLGPLMRQAVEAAKRRAGELSG